MIAGLNSCVTLGLRYFMMYSTVHQPPAGPASLRTITLRLLHTCHFPNMLSNDRQGTNRFIEASYFVKDIFIHSEYILNRHSPTLVSVKNYAQ